MEHVAAGSRGHPDSVLAVSGRLNPLMGGPGFFPRIDKDLLEGAVTWFEPSPPEARNRRSLYMYQAAQPGVAPGEGL